MAKAVAHVLGGTQPYRPPFLQSPGRPPVPWQRWLAMFEDWLLAIGFPETEAMAPRKAALLRASLGTEGFRIYSSLATDPREPYDNAVGRLAAHFGQPASAIFNRAQFTRRQQRPGESVTQYVAALREMAARCEFSADQLDERVRDQFVAWSCSDRIRERLLQEPATRKLEDFVRLALTVERAMSEAPALSPSVQPPPAAVGLVGGHQRSVSPASQSGCWNCGRQGHTSRSADCPARGQSCRNCCRVGHFASRCRSRAAVAATSANSRAPERSHSRVPGRAGRSQSRRRRSRPQQANQIVDSDVAAEPDDVINSLFINTVHVGAVQLSKPGAFKHIVVRLSGVPIDFVLDLGAKVSIVNGAQYEASLKRVAKLRPATQTLRTYSGQPIACLGCIEASVSLGVVSLPSFTFYVTAKGDSVLGVDLFDALGGTVQLSDISLVSRAAVGVVTSLSPPLPSPPAVPPRPSSSSSSPTQPPSSTRLSPLSTSPPQLPPPPVPPRSSSSPLLLTSSLSSVTLADYPALTKGLGRLRGFIHRPKVDPSVRPVQQRFYHQPLSLRQPISDELRRMEQDGVIERISSSVWISNIVVARKKCGGVRLCVNLSAVNKALIPERYPLPTMEELTEKVAGCTVFSKIDLAWGYMQLELAESCRYLTAFVTHDGVYQWRSLPFGLASGPSAFHQVIRLILENLEGCANILDDILVCGRDVEEHDRRLRAV